METVWDFLKGCRATLMLSLRGDVWEWTSSSYSCGPDETSDTNYAVIRGGARVSSDTDMSTSNRHLQDKETGRFVNSSGSYSDDVVGFRCVVHK